MWLIWAIIEHKRYLKATKQVLTTMQLRSQWPLHILKKMLVILVNRVVDAKK
jgi:hypothetical protein